MTATHRLALAAAAPLAALAAALAPSSALLPGPDGVVEIAAATVALTAAFALGLLVPRTAIFALLGAIVLEGAFRKWLLNDVTVFLVKDFLLLGIYAAVLPLLRRDEWRRPWWLLVPLAGVLGLAVVYVARSESWSTAAIGLRAYALYVPLLWAAPRLIDTRRRGEALVVSVLGIAAAEATIGAVQALTGGEWVNRLVPGSLPALITVDGVAYLRPTGTTLQVGVFAAIVLFGFLAAYALAISYERGPLLILAVAGTAVLTWGFVYASSRALSGTLLIATAGAIAYLVARRRFLTLAALAGAAAIGFVFLQHQPFLGGPVREGDEAFYLRNETYRVFDENGEVTEVVVSIGTGNPGATGGFVTRPLAPENSDPASVTPNATSSRFRAQVDVIRDQGAVGHGVGTMTVGSEYAIPGRKLPGESEYAKLAYELGLPGLVLYVWLLAAVAVLSLLGFTRTDGRQRALAAVGLGAAVCLPAWMSLTFALDTPLVAMLYWTFAGCAVAYGLRPEERPVDHGA